MRRKDRDGGGREGPGRTYAGHFEVQAVGRSEAALPHGGAIVSGSPFPSPAVVEVREQKSFIEERRSHSLETHLWG